MILRIFLLVLSGFSIGGCSSMKPEDFAGTEPRFELERYFEGRTKAWGIFEDRSGRLRRSFTVDILGEWDGRILTLTEDFLYDDGEEDQRIWTIVKLPDGRYEGRADDVIGVAKGLTVGKALNWRYTLALPVGDSVWNVRFDDWMFLQDDETVINRARVSKWGFALGEVTLFFRKESGKAAAMLPRAWRAAS